MKEVDIKDIQLKLYEKLKPSGWGDKLKSFILSSDFENILNRLYLESRKGIHFTPILKQVFRAFEECPYQDLKVVLIGQDPYPQKGVADGIAFSGSNKNETEASLRYIFNAIAREVYNKEGYKWDPDLKRWSNQGILMLNSALTTTIAKSGAHHELWKPFMSFLLDMISINNPGLIYGFIGAKAKAYEDIIPDNSSHKFYVSHPASAMYNNFDWATNGFFKDIHECCKKNFGYEIIW